MQDLNTLQDDGFLEIESVRSELPKGKADAIASVSVGDNSFELVVEGDDVLLYSCGLHLETRPREDLSGPEDLRKFLEAHMTQ